MGKPRDEAAPSAPDLTMHLPGQAFESNQTCHFVPTPTEPIHPRRPDPNQGPAPDTSTQTCDLNVSELLDPSPAREGVAPTGPPTSSVLPGVTVPGYEILAELGRGGMGVVYKARHLRLQRLVALKMILAGAHAGAAGLARFRAEAEAVARLQHPNIVQIYETGEHEGRPYFSLEFAEEGSLEQRMQESPLTPLGAAELVETLARAMEVAHQQGIIHRDLKPGNVLLATGHGQASLIRKPSMFRREHLSGSSMASDHWSRTTVPKIADFGLAKRLDDDSGNTQSGTILGTPSYMAPEQAEGKIKDVGPPTDVYALGAILYELLTGRPPFKAGNPIDTIRQLLTQEPVAPRQLEPSVHRDLETICLKCLEKVPARRYASGSALADDLRRFLNDEPIRARPTPAWELAWKWGKRRPAVLALLGVGLLAIVAMGLFVVWHNVTLQDELTQARAEERLAREREQQAREGERLSRLESEGQKLLQDARVAAASRDWTNARLHLTRALATVGSEPGLDKLKRSTQTLLAQAEEHLRIEADREASRTRYQRFGKLRDEALFLGCLYTGMDLAANLKATRKVVHTALGVYGITTEAGRAGAAALDPYLDAAQKTEIQADCYQLLLILAETEAQSVVEGGPPARFYQEALRLLEQALRFGSPSRAYHLRRARYLSRLDDGDGARREDRIASTKAVQNVLDHFLVGDEYYRRARFAEASASFDQVLRLKPAHFWAQYLNALCLMRQRRPAEARAQLSSCLAQRTDFVWLYLQRGVAQAELQAYEAAEADFQKALEMPLDEFSRYVLFVNRGVLRVRQGRLDDAISDLKSAIALKPREYQAYANLAQAHRQQKDLGRALEQLHRALELEPGLPHLHRLRARLHLERKEPDRALEDFAQVIRREDPTSPFLADDQVEYGRLLMGKGRHLEALAAFDGALRLRKDHSLAQRSRAEVLFHLGRHQEVLEAFDRYLLTGKPLESVYRGRGLARAELGKYPGAIEDYTKALELLPTAAVQTYRGWAHLVCDAPKLALRDFELALQLDPKYADAHAGRGFVLASQGRDREAVHAAESALRQGPRSTRLLYNVARIHAQCPGTNVVRAIELLQQALEMMPAEQRAAFWARNVRADPALVAIRRHPRFSRLEAIVSPRK